MVRSARLNADLIVKRERERFRRVLVLKQKERLAALLKESLKRMECSERENRKIMRNLRRALKNSK